MIINCQTQYFWLLYLNTAHHVFFILIVYKIHHNPPKVLADGLLIDDCILPSALLCNHGRATGAQIEVRYV